MHRPHRRRFLQQSLGLGAAALAAGAIAPRLALGQKPDANMALGLCTYLWGKDWDLPTLIANCTKTGILGVELRVDHAHGVGPALTAAQRAEVRKQFADSAVEFVGPGSNEAFHYADAAVLKKNIENTKAWIKLSHDCGGSGVKVKPNDLPKQVPQEKTIEQIGKALNEVAAFGADFGQEIRLEVHGQCSPLPIMKQIMDVADHPNARVCWNSNPEDLQGEGLKHNFNLVKKRFGHTVHVRELNVGDYPYQDLVRLLVGADYSGWVLLECRTNPADLVAALAEQRKVFEEMVAKARA